MMMDETREQKADKFKRESSKAYHTSDCATSMAPAMEPGPCDCDAPEAGAEPLSAEAFERSDEWLDTCMAGHPTDGYSLMEAYGAHVSQAYERRMRELEREALVRNAQVEGYQSQWDERERQLAEAREALREDFIILAGLLLATTWELAPKIRQQIQKARDQTEEVLRQGESTRKALEDKV